jgi:hypothetical protein
LAVYHVIAEVTLQDVIACAPAYLIVPIGAVYIIITPCACYDVRAGGAYYGVVP